MFSFNFRAGERSNCQLYDIDPFEFNNGCQIIGGARNEDPNACRFPIDDCLVSILLNTELWMYTITYLYVNKQSISVCLLLLNNNSSWTYKVKDKG